MLDHYSADSISENCRQFVLKSFNRQAPDWVLVCGSGLGEALLAGLQPSLTVEVVAEIGLQELGLPVPSVEGHGQTLVLGHIASMKVAIQTGRIHPYEGHPLDICCAALRGILDSGTRGLMLTCAVGALRAELLPGQLVVIRDHINLMGPTPLVGPKFVDCSEVYHSGLRGHLASGGRGGGPTLEQVVYAHARGPQFETPAEVEALRRLGGDVVGMSTTYEAILGRSYGVTVGGLGIVTNSAGATGLSHREVQERALAGRGQIGKCLTNILGGAPPGSAP